MGGELDFIIASTQRHVPPTQGLRARCVPDEIRFFVTLPRLGHTGEWTNDMAVMLAQLLAVRRLNGSLLYLFELTIQIRSGGAGCGYYGWVQVGFFCAAESWGTEFGFLDFD
jgi:hypothetical protein